MKRSEMKAAIYNALYGATMLEDFAEQILGIVEACGMLPPLDTTGEGEDTNQWEPETEATNENA